MEKRKLGNTDILVSKICLGTMTWGKQNTQEEAFEQLDYALEKGINFIDAAEIYPVPPEKDRYGKTEEHIGHWFKARNNRESVVLATKIAGPGVAWIRGAEGFTASGIEAAVEGSLKRLQTDYIDLYQLHWPQRDVPKWGRTNYHENMLDEKSADQILEVLQALDKVVGSGKVRQVGLSNETPWGVSCFLNLAEKQGLPRMQSIQNAYSLLRREYEVGLAEISMYEKIGLLAYSPLAGGVLTGKYRGGKIPKSSRMELFPSMMGYYMNPLSHQHIEKLSVIAEELEMSLAQLSLAYVNDRGFVTSNIIGATSMEQLHENISSAEITLSPVDRKKIEDAIDPFSNPA